MGAEPGPDPSNLGDLGMNAGWVADLREQYDLHPKNVDESWADVFGRNGDATLEAPPVRPQAPESAVAANLGPAIAPSGVRRPSAASEDPGEELRRVGPEIARKHAATLRLIHAYRARGHRVALTNPLVDEPRTFSELELANYGFTDADMDRSFLAGNLPGGPVQTFREILEQLRETYCRHVGVEFTHIQDPDRKEWLVDRMEHTRNETHFTTEERREILESLVAAEMFERFVHTRFLGQKRFSLEGAESLIPLLNEMVERAPHYGVREFVFGMAHRGRLNVLCNIVGKSWESVFSEFEDTPNLEVPFGSGDVKYHKGFSSNRVTRSGQTVHLSLTSNPSHLEMVNPVVEGRARAKQTRANDFIGHSIVPVLIHGDAAFAGQGVVAETLNLSQLQGYFTGGTLHIIVDNQIGFTTTPAEARSTLYATDVAKMIQVPIFHVNGDRPEAVLHAMRLALSYRQRFRSDVVINLVCYRRHGHNEGDEPGYTQPRLYEKIKNMVPVRKQYTEHLIELGVLTRSDAEEIEETLSRKLDEALERIKTAPPEPSEGYEPRGPWSGFSRTLPKAEPPTSVEAGRVQTLMDRAGRLPDGLPHPSQACQDAAQTDGESGRGRRPRLGVRGNVGVRGSLG